MSAGRSSRATELAVLTAAGRGAIAVVGVAGPRAVEVVDRYFLAANGRPLRQRGVNRVCYGRWMRADGEDVVVCRRETDLVEIHCHGGPWSISQVVQPLQQAGCVVVDSSHWLAARHDGPLQAEAAMALTQAPTLRTAAILLDQYQGALTSKLCAIRSHLDNHDAQAAKDQARQLLQYAELGRHLTEPWHVALTGLPNVGKSCLTNALVGYQRAIVFDQPGTTRDVVSTTTAAHGWPLRLHDTAGLGETTDPLDRAGIVQTREQLQQADLVLWVLDASAWEAGSTDAAQQLARRQALQVNAACPWTRVLVVVNKVDLQPTLAGGWGDATATCAITGQGIAELLAAVAQRLVPCPPAAGTAVPFTPQQVALLERVVEQCDQGQVGAASDWVGQHLTGVE